jgi:hypothetical protein
MRTIIAHIVRWSTPFYGSRENDMGPRNVVILFEESRMAHAHVSGQSSCIDLLQDIL